MESKFRTDRNASPKPALKQSTFAAAGAELSRTNNVRQGRTVQYKPTAEQASAPLSIEKAQPAPSATNTTQIDDGGLSSITYDLSNQ